MQAVGRERHSLSMWILQSLCLIVVYPKYFMLLRYNAHGFCEPAWPAYLKTELAPRRSWKTCSRFSFPPSCEISLCVSPIRYLSHFSGLFMNFYAFRFAYGLWPLKKICLSGAGGSAAAKFDKAWRVGRVNIESVGRIRVRFSAWTSWLGNWGISAS